MRKTSIEKECEACGAPFTVQAYRASQAKFCSMDCLWKARKPRPKSEIAATCEHCGKEYAVSPYRTLKTRFCSKQCHGAQTIPKSPRTSPSEKRCSKCGTEKPSSGFGKRASSPDGLRAECKVCWSKSNAIWGRENRKRKKTNSAIYHAEHREEHKVRAAVYYQANKTKRDAANKAWVKANAATIKRAARLKRLASLEAYRENRRQHYRENKARYVANARRRELDKIQRTPAWADLNAIMVFYAEAQRLTAETGIKHHVDHTIPLRGKLVSGLHIETNLQILTASTNLKKGNRFNGYDTGLAIACSK